MKFIQQYKNLSKEIYILFFGRIVTSMGSLIWPLLTLILKNKLGYSATTIATLTMAMSILQFPMMLLGLDVLPEYRGQGLAREIVNQYIKREKEKGRKLLLLTCLPEKVEMYKKFGFMDHGIANSSWGGEEWHEMAYVISE